MSWIVAIVCIILVLACWRILVPFAVVAAFLCGLVLLYLVFWNQLENPVENPMPDNETDYVAEQMFLPQSKF